MQNNTEKNTGISMPIRRLLLAICCSFVLASCGGGGSNSSAPPTPVAEVKTEIINNIVVPLAPDPVKNSATVVGVDSNNNGIRDDVERKAAKDSTSAQRNKEILEIMKEAEFILKTKDANRLKLDCLLNKYKSTADFMSEAGYQDILLDTNERNSEEVINKVSGLVLGECNE